MSKNPSRLRAFAAHNNARRFAEQAQLETDETMKAYWRHLAVSWNDIAEQQEFLAECSGSPRSIADAPTSSPHLDN